MTRTSFRSGLILVAAISSLTLSGLSSAADADRVDKVSNKDFAATAKTIETTLKSSGFMIFATIDHQKVGANLKGAKTIEFGMPDMIKGLLQMDPEAGLGMPGRMYVWERSDGKTVVSYHKPSSDFSKHGDEKLIAMGNMMNGTWDMIAEEATK
ncbi:MAG: hypothetical protein B7Z60_07935 [Ferrovum sp. 37-45-19]|nr:MAG: hypothetical protein B7Z65_02970 [Ferrovum sp. 21-44-67]OYV93597.1 MAG: hypothetical protein B7Z60_07935 [Ferrovum sp. 37-45-19]OZB33507.1 MAG: hypothetical protein B7X47_03900 [Ferrovum sp. 34-44-207]